MNENGTLEWVSRKKCKPHLSDDLTQYENKMEKLRELCRMESQVNTPGLAMQTIMPQMQAVQMEAIMCQLQPPMPPLSAPLQQCCVQYPTQYPSYYYGGCCRLN